VHIGAGVTVGGMAGVAGSVPDGERYAGFPARPEKDAIKVHLAMGRLPEMRIQLRELEAAVKQLRAELSGLKSSAAQSERAA
jgi:UDP-3-O-[3-hydroxymyristoyl] glucosamine N-acyltransferase